MAEAETLQVDLDARQYAAALTVLRRFGPTVAPLMRARLLEIGERVADDARRQIRAYPVRGGKRSIHRGVREKLAASIVVKARTTGFGQDVLIISTGEQLPVQQQPLVKAWNTAAYRHPTFGRHRWVEQEGARYFRGSMAERRSGEVAAALEDVVREAAGAA